MDPLWKRAIDFVINVAANGAYDALFYYLLRERGIIKTFTPSSSSTQSVEWNEGIQKIRDAKAQSAPPPLPIAVRFDIRRGNQLILFPGFLSVFWDNSRTITVDTQIPPQSMWRTQDWRNRNEVLVYIIQKDLKQLKIRMAFNPGLKTDDGHAIRHCEVNASFKIDSPVLFIDEFLRGNTPIFEENEFIENYLTDPFTKALRRFVSRFTRRKLEDMNINAEFQNHLETSIQIDANLRRILKESGMKFIAINNVKITWDNDIADELFERTCHNQSNKFRPRVIQELYDFQEGEGAANEILWQTQLRGKISGKPAFDGDSRCIAIATEQGHVYFLDDAGKERGRYVAQGESFDAGVVFWQEKAIVTSYAGKIWQVPVPDEDSSTYGTLNSANMFFIFNDKVVRTPPAILENVAYFSIPDLRESGIYRLPLDSSQLSPQEIYLCAPNERIKTSPHIVRNHFILFTASKGWGRCSLDGSSCQYVPYPGNSNGRVAGRSIAYEANSRTLFIAHTDLGLLAIDIDTERVKGQAGGNASLWVTPTLYRDIAFAGDDKGQVLAINTDGRNPNPDVWPMQISTKPIKSQAAVWKDLLFVADTAGVVYAIKINEGSIWWTFSAGSAIFAPLSVVGKGVIISADADGGVSAIKWHLDKVGDAIKMLKRWGDIEQAGHLALLHGQYKTARHFWSQARSSLGSRIISQCLAPRSDGQAPARADGKDGAPMLRHVLTIEGSHNPNCELGQTVTFTFYVKLLADNVFFDRLFLWIEGDVQEPIIEKTLSKEQIKTLIEKKSLTLKQEIIPSRLGNSQIQIRIGYEEFGEMNDVEKEFSIFVRKKSQPIQTGDVGLFIINTEEGVAIETGDIAVFKNQGDIDDIHIEGDAGAVINRGGDIGDVTIGGDAGLVRSSPSSLAPGPPQLATPTIICPSCGLEQPATHSRCQNPRCGEPFIQCPSCGLYQPFDKTNQFCIHCGASL